MASCITQQWVATAPQIKLTVTQESATSTTATLRWVLQYVASSPASASARPYTAVVNGKTVASGTYAINGKTGTYTIDEGTVDITKGSSAKTVSFSCSMEFTLTWSGVYAGTKSASGSISVSSVTAYTVTYNANGGSGAPSSQTKTHGVALTLSSATPTRTGYTFQGWALSSTGSVRYDSGDSYTANESVTLYAVWGAKGYTVTYNANGGSGAPSSQTKTHGVALTLSSATPTRKNYKFLGWGLTESAATVWCNPGDQYTSNVDITLYAVWELAYIAPRVTNVSMNRCSSNGTVNDNGTYALIKFNWQCDRTVKSIVIKWKASAQSTWTSLSVTASGTSGSVSEVIGSGALSTDNTYTVVATVSDDSGSTPVTRTLAGMRLMLDFMDENKGAAIGKTAEVEGVLDIGFQTRLMGGILHPVLESGVNLDDVTIPNTYILTSGRTYTNTPESGVGAILDVVGGASRVQRWRSVSHDYPRSYERAWYDDYWGDWKCVERKYWPSEAAALSNSNYYGYLYVSFNTALDLVSVCGTVGIIPSASIAAGELITVAAFTGPAVPYRRVALSVYSNSTNARRWMGYIGTDGTINVRSSTSLTANTDYEISINAVYMNDGMTSIQTS